MDVNLLLVGTKIELTKQVSKRDNDFGKKNITYVSQILDIDGNELICAMPIQSGHIIPLELGVMFDTYFYLKRGIYKGICKVSSRSKEGNIYTCQLTLVSSLEKFQRRDFYRLSCTLDIGIISLNENEVNSYAKTGKIPEVVNDTKKEGVAVDISGGGMRVITPDYYDKGTFVMLCFELNSGEDLINFKLIGQINQSVKCENNSLMYDNRIQFMGISSEMQDEVVKYIFEEQRRQRKKERGE